jgi:hypothetical protein
MKRFLVVLANLQFLILNLQSVRTVIYTEKANLELHTANYGSAVRHFKLAESYRRFTGPADAVAHGSHQPNREKIDENDDYPNWRACGTDSCTSSGGSGAVCIGAARGHAFPGFVCLPVRQPRQWG